MVAAALQIPAFALLLLLLFPLSATGFIATDALRLRHSRRTSHESTATTDAPSLGVQAVIAHLNTPKALPLLLRLALLDEKLGDEVQSANFWFGGSAEVKGATCVGVAQEGIQLRVDLMMKGKISQRQVLARFPEPVTDEAKLKLVLIKMAINAERLEDTAALASLPFGDDTSMPTDFKFNNVPHAEWVRSYLYSRATQAVLRAIEDPSISSYNRTRLQLRVNYPEVNPAFDTYRLGTLLEMVRDMALTLAEDGKRVRICVQQALGEGIFVGMPLALSSMRVVLEKMDWGGSLTKEQKWQPGDSAESPRPEALIRLGTVGADQVAADDDVLICVCPQNVIGGLLIEELEKMVKAASGKGKALVLINPSLQDRPSSNNVMQVRGRAERRAFENSFIDIYALRLLYPSNGGYMFPIRGMISKKGWREPWCVYSREEDARGQEVYRLLAAFPPHPSPDAGTISRVYTSGINAVTDTDIDAGAGKR